MTTPSATDAERALLIRKLLAKAEAKGATEHEREAFNAKATELMIKWGIEAAMITDADRLTVEQIIKQLVVANVPKSYSYEYAEIIIAVATAFGCKGLLQGRGRGETNALIVGFESDVQSVVTIGQSLVAQCTMALAIWYPSVRRDWWTGTDAYRARKGFISGFASGVREKFTALKHHVIEETPGSALVLVDRSKRVDGWIADNLKTGPAAARRYDVGARVNGFGAGQRADIGQSTVGGGRTGISR